MMLILPPATLAIRTPINTGPKNGGHAIRNMGVDFRRGSRCCPWTFPDHLRSAVFCSGLKSALCLRWLCSL